LPLPKKHIAVEYKKEIFMEFTNKQRMLLYNNLVFALTFENKMVDSYRRGKVPAFYHCGRGHEAIGVGAGTFLRRNDYFVMTHRDRGSAFSKTKGEFVEETFAELYGRSIGLAKGKGGEHSAIMKYGIPGGSGSIGGSFPISVGLGMAAKMSAQGQVVVCLFGDGAAQRGTLHESMNWASVQKLPIVWVCGNNLYAISMPLSASMPIKDIADLAGSYAMPGEIVDGMDVEEVAAAVLKAVDRARNGEGPSLIECKTYRFRRHGEMEPPGSYRSKEEVEEWKKKDPVILYEEKLLAMNVISTQDIENTRAETERQVDMAETKALEAPWPEPETAYEDLYAD
jgi:TPP-dependent pyruvate/acetoin dehydrogenase alpha subunit